MTADKDRLTDGLVAVATSNKEKYISIKDFIFSHPLSFVVP
jgi:hypothetical protein